MKINALLWDRLCGLRSGPGFVWSGFLLGLALVESWFRNKTFEND